MDLIKNSFYFSEDSVTLGSRFSKSSSEREKILHKRKENMIQMARKRYIEKRKAAAAVTNSGSGERNLQS